MKTFEEYLLKAEGKIKMNLFLTVYASSFTVLMISLVLYDSMDQKFNAFNANHFFVSALLIPCALGLFFLAMPVNKEKTHLYACYLRDEDERKIKVEIKKNIEKEKLKKQQEAYMESLSKTIKE